MQHLTKIILRLAIPASLSAPLMWPAALHPLSRNQGGDNAHGFLSVIATVPLCPIRRVLLPTLFANAALSGAMQLRVIGLGLGVVVQHGVVVCVQVRAARRRLRVAGRIDIY